MECCQNKTQEKRKGFFWGLFYGLVPHVFCIAFIIFTVLGTTVATAFLKPLLLNPYFFYLLIVLSFVFATISAAVYLRKNSIFSFKGVKRKWKYLTILYSTTILVNLLFFMIIFPAAANFKIGEANSTVIADSILLSSATLKVAIPCSGHAPLIMTELKKINGVADVKFKFPNLFEVAYDQAQASENDLLSLVIFQEYQATIVQ